MKVGLIFDFANPAPWRRSGPDVYEEALTMAHPGRPHVVVARVEKKY